MNAFVRLVLVRASALAVSAMPSVAGAQLPSANDLVCCERVDFDTATLSCDVETFGHCSNDLAAPIPDRICCAVAPLADACTGNACTAPLPGSCAQGAYQCLEGRLACVPSNVEACPGSTPPCPETCDGLDNDCDGKVDEGLGVLTCGQGACFRQVRRCENGQLQECVPGEPSEEVCDCVDNDCDGQLNEGFPECDISGCPH
jgi:hypothetical protein